jgi:hypothetical protein
VRVAVGVAETAGVMVLVKLPGTTGAAGLVLVSQPTPINKVKGSIKNSPNIRKVSKTFIFFTKNPFVA